MTAHLSLPRWLPLLILALTIGALFHRLLGGDVLFWGLPALQFYPWRVFAQNELGSGRLPLWNPYNGAGAPLLANYQSGIFYPPNLLTLWIDGPGVLGLLGIAHIFVCGAGMWCYLGAIRANRLGCAVGSLSFALGTTLVARFGTLPMLYTAAWLPWLLWAAHLLIDRLTLRRFTLAAALVALLLLAGHAQWAFYSLSLAALYGLYRIGHSRTHWRLALPLIAALVLGAALAAIQLGPTAELQRQSQRAGGVDEVFALNYSYEWALMPTLLASDFYGNPGDGSYAIGGAQFETAAYIGVLPLLAALATLIQWLRRLRRAPIDDESRALRRLIPFFGIVALVGFVFALGKNSIVYVFLFRYVPTFGLFQAPARWLLWVAFALSVLAAIGFTTWKPDRFYKMRLRLLLTGSGTITIIMLIARLVAPQTIVNGLFIAGLGLTVSAALLLAQPRPDRTHWRRWALTVVVFVAIDLGWANRGFNPATTPDFYSPQTGLTKGGRGFNTENALTRLQFDDFLLFNDYRVAGQKRAAYRAAGLPNINIIDKVTLFNNFDPLRPAGFEKFSKLLNDHPAANLIQAAAIATDSIPNPPRAWLVATAIGSADPFKAMADPTWSPLQSVFLEGDAPTFRGNGHGTATITGETPQRIDLAVTAETPMILIVADSWYPGWNAVVDNVEVPIFRANGAFRGVAVPAGAHTVRFTYDPASLKIGGLISGLAWIILAGLIIFDFASSARRPRPAR